MERKLIELKNYRAPSHQVLNLELWFDLYDDHCIVRQRSRLKQSGADTQLFLDGEELECVEVRINDAVKPIGESSMIQITTEGMQLKNLPPEFTLDITTKIFPQKNTALEGLYKSRDLFCTQCEAQGFRRITYFQDRPDVMTKYTVHIAADEKKYPQLLSNGNRIASQKLDKGRHAVTWQDPFNKPSYLFALVAGNLGVLKDEFKTQSGRNVRLEIYSPHGTQSRCEHAMQSLKKAMRWDEERFGREYDLDVFMILAVDDFNMGAMENKGLNIFNSRLVFADPQTATDSEYFNIEAVVGHEYFHNWTGNRVTVRDWFHLSLKEGLTVFRDQEFSGDMSSREKVRIDNVAELRERQFAEDAGPNAHPIRPESCYAVDNFYTSTIYEKGAEVIRMMQTLVGRPGFRKGMDLYFDRFDGKAVIIEDFAKAISDANQQEWSQFKQWYSQKGTPVVKVTENFKNGVYELNLKQSGSAPLHIPLVFGLIDDNGKQLDIPLGGAVSKNTEGQTTLNFKDNNQTWSLPGLKTKPHLSLNRQFSAPVVLDWQLSHSDLSFLIEKDEDSFCRWEASQQLLLREFAAHIQNPAHKLPEEFLRALSQVLTNRTLPEDFRSTFLNLPSDSYLLQNVNEFSSPKFLQARDKIETQIATQLSSELEKLYIEYNGRNLLSKDPQDFGRRALKNGALAMLASDSKYRPLAKKQFHDAKIMTDELTAYSILADIPDWAEEAHSTFFNKWSKESLVLNKWFTVQALSRLPSTFQNVVRLCGHKDFEIKNPNRVYSLLRAFGQNLCRFHDSEQDTYTFMADRIIEIDKLNPQVATRLASAFDVWKKLDRGLQTKARAQLERMNRSSLSKNTYEIVEKQLR